MTIGQGAYGRRMQEQATAAKRGDYNARNRIRGKILQVYDRAWLDSNEPDIRLGNLIAQAPGALWAKVQVVKSGQEHILRFGFSDPEILSYNAESLKGLYVVIEYMGFNIETGTLTLAGQEDKLLSNLDTNSRVADIGDIL